MLQATDFTYDGISSTMYGLKIATFDESTLVNTPYVTPTIKTAKPAKSKKFLYQDITYDNPPTYEFSIVCEEPISDLILREILSWLEARKGYRILKFHQPGLEDYTYNCIFTVSNIIYHTGNCVGLTLVANFDSIYMYGNPVVIEATVAEGATQVEVKDNSVDTPNGDGYSYAVPISSGRFSIDLVNESESEDEFIYPIVEFKNNQNCIRITTYAKEDEETLVPIAEEFKYEQTNGGATFVAGTTFRIDNERKIVGLGENNAAVGLLANFNKKWLKLKKGYNLIEINFGTFVMTAGDTVKITCPTYAKIRF